MQSTVHRSRIYSALLCALGTLLVLTQFGYAQEGVPVSQAGEEAVPVATQTEEGEAVPPIPEVAVTSAYDYPKEGIPGGAGIVGDFVVGPGKIDVSLKPGESRVVEMIVTNRTGERRIFNLTTEDMTGSTDLSKPVVLLGAERGPYSLRDYLSVPRGSFELEHNQRARIPVTIAIPPDAEPGGLYGSMLVDTVAIEADTGETTNTVPQSAIIARIGTLFFVTVEGEALRDAALIDFGTTGKQTVFGKGPVTFGILHRNNGSIHIAPYGEVRVHNMLGEEVGFVQLDPWFVLPGSERIREITWNHPFLLGRYTATAQVNRSYDDIVDVREFTFWVLPWKVLLGGFLGVFLVLFIIRAFFRTFEFKRRS